jgi:uncharacterized protein YybS (DUF2232 family)
MFLFLPVPVVGLFGAMVSPLPLIVQRLRSGVGSALLATVLAAGVIGIVFTAGLGVGFLLFLAAPGLLMGQAMARGRGLVRGCGWAFALLAAEIAAGLLFAGPSMADLVLDSAAQLGSPQFLQEMRSSGLPPEKVDEWAEQFATFRKVMEVVYPAFFIILGALVVLANAVLLRTYLARRDPGWLDGGEFETIRWPLGFAVLFVLAGASVVFPPVRPAGYNVLLVLAFFFALQGLAVVAYYARRLAAPPLLRGGLMLLVLLNPWAPQILGLLGLFDIWIDFRKYADPPESQAG